MIDGHVRRTLFLTFNRVLLRIWDGSSKCERGCACAQVPAKQASPPSIGGRPGNRRGWLAG